MGRQYVTEAHARDILCTACEGAINYWCNNLPDGPIIHDYEYQDESAPAYLQFEPGVREYSGQECPALRITRAELEAAVLAILFPQGPHVVNSRVRGQIGAGFDSESFDGDADCADAIVQVALFGRLIFG